MIMDWNSEPALERSSTFFYADEVLAAAPSWANDEYFHRPFAGRRCRARCRSGRHGIGAVIRSLSR